MKSKTKDSLNRDLLSGKYRKKIEIPKKGKGSYVRSRLAKADFNFYPSLADVQNVRKFTSGSSLNGFAKADVVWCIQKIFANICNIKQEKKNISQPEQQSALVEFLSNKESIYDFG